jgi:hypothetical protein
VSQKDEKTGWSSSATTIQLFFALDGERSVGRQKIEGSMLAIDGDLRAIMAKQKHGTASQEPYAAAYKTCGSKPS